MSFVQLVMFGTCIQGATNPWTSWGWLLKLGNVAAMSVNVRGTSSLTC